MTEIQSHVGAGDPHGRPFVSSGPAEGPTEPPQQGRSTKGHGRTSSKRWKLKRVASGHLAAIALGYPEVSLLVLKKRNPLRSFCIRVTNEKWFENFILLCILCNCITLGMSSNRTGFDQTAKGRILNDFEYLWVAIFSIEALMKIISMGFVFSPGTYLRDGWNVVDFVVVALGYLDIFTSGNMTALRTVRVLRPLRAITSVRGMKVLVLTMLESIPMLIDVVFLGALMFFVWGLVAVQLFAGALRSRCGLPLFDYAYTVPYSDGRLELYNVSYTVPDNATRDTCSGPRSWDTLWYQVGGAPLAVPGPDGLGFTCEAGSYCTAYGNPNYGMTSFDNILWAWLTIFQCITLESWTDVLYYTADAVTWWVWPFFVALIVFGSFYVLNLALAVLYIQFSSHNQGGVGGGGGVGDFPGCSGGGSHPPQQQEQQRLGVQLAGDEYDSDVVEDGTSSSTASGSPKSPEGGASERSKAAAAAAAEEEEEEEEGRQGWKMSWLSRRSTTLTDSDLVAMHPVRRALCRVATSKHLSYTTMALIAFNTVIMCINWHGMPYKVERATDYINYALTVYFLVEMVIKVAGLGLRRYVSDGMNVFDALVVAVSVTEMIVDLLPSASGVGPLSVLRLLRIFRLARNWRELALIIRAIFKSITSTGYLLLLTLLFIFIAALMGMQLFGYEFMFCDYVEGASPVCPLGEEVWGQCPNHFYCYLPCTAGQYDTWIDAPGSFYNGLAYCERFCASEEAASAAAAAAAGNTTVADGSGVGEEAAAGGGGAGAGGGCEYLAVVGKSQVPRGQFDNIFWAMYTVFQLLTGENWNVVMYDGMRTTSPWSALYFVAVLLIGTYLVFNLFIAILLDNFTGTFSSGDGASADDDGDGAAASREHPPGDGDGGGGGGGAAKLQQGQPSDVGIKPHPRAGSDSSSDSDLAPGLEGTSAFGSMRTDSSAFCAAALVGLYRLDDSEDEDGGSGKDVSGGAGRGPRAGANGAANGAVGAGRAEAEAGRSTAGGSPSTRQPPPLQMSLRHTMSDGPTGRGGGGGDTDTTATAGPPVGQYPSSQPQPQPQPQPQSQTPPHSPQGPPPSQTPVQPPPPPALQPADVSSPPPLDGGSRLSADGVPGSPRGAVARAGGREGIGGVGVDGAGGECVASRGLGAGPGPKAAARRAGSFGVGGGGSGKVVPLGVEGRPASSIPSSAYGTRRFGSSGRRSAWRGDGGVKDCSKCADLDAGDSKGPPPPLLPLPLPLPPAAAATTAATAVPGLKPGSNSAAGPVGGKGTPADTDGGGDVYGPAKAKATALAQVQEDGAPGRPPGSLLLLGCGEAAAGAVAAAAEAAAAAAAAGLGTSGKGAGGAGASSALGGGSFLCRGLGRVRSWLHSLRDVRRNEHLAPFVQGRSLLLFGPDHWFRWRTARVVHHTRFEAAVLALVVASSVALALDTPSLDRHSRLATALRVVDYVCTGAFAVEAALKIITFGFAFTGPHAYIRNGWNILDLSIVLVGFAYIVVQAAGADEANLQALRVLRVLRALRPLRAASSFEGLRTVVNALFAVLPAMANVALVCLLFYLVFAILSVNLFKGKLYGCVDSASGEMLDPFYYLPAGVRMTRAWCEAGGGNVTVVAAAYFSGRNVTLPPYQMSTTWVNRVANFDNVGIAILSLIQVATLELWVDIMFSAVDAVGVDQQPLWNHQPAVILFFIVFIIVGSFFILNLFIGVTLEKFDELQRAQTAPSVFVTPHQQAWVDLQRLLLRTPMQVRPARPYEPYWRTALYDMVTRSGFNNFILGSILVNTLFMAMVHADMSRGWLDCMSYTNLIFTAIFVVEAALKIAAFGPRAYFRDRWNAFDFFVVVVSAASVALDFSDVRNLSFMPVLRALRIVRVFRMLRRTPGLQRLLMTLVYSLPALVNVGCIMLLLFTVYAIIGMNLFGGVKFGDYLNRHANFNNFPSAMLVLMRMITGESWSGIMQDCMITHDCVLVTAPVTSPATNTTLAPGTYLSPRDPLLSGVPSSALDDQCSLTPFAAVIYFPTFVVLCGFVMLNLVIAIILEVMMASEADEALPVPKSLVEQFAEAWAAVDASATGYIHASKLPLVIDALSPPLGTANMGSRAAIQGVIMSVDIPVHGDNTVSFLETLHALAGRVAGTELPEIEEEDLVRRYAKRLPGGGAKFPKYTAAHFHAALYVKAAIRGFLARHHLRAAQTPPKQ